MTFEEAQDLRDAAKKVSEETNIDAHYNAYILLEILVELKLFRQFRV